MFTLPQIEQARIEGFWNHVVERFRPPSPTVAAIVTHLIPDRPYFLNALGEAITIGSVIPKPRSLHEETLRIVQDRYRCDRATRAELGDPTFTLRLLREIAGRNTLVLLDIGGYFSEALHYVCDHMPGQILGVVEDTENGLQRYERLQAPPCPILSVARSPLKNPEDYLVGQAVMFSVEHLLRQCNYIFQGRRAAVFGYGKLGRSVAHMLHSRNVRTVVVDIDPIKRVEALSHGFDVVPKNEALSTATLIVCATGRLSLARDDFRLIRNGAFLASVTSSDDELELPGITDIYHPTSVAENVKRYETTGHYFYVLNDGNAVNFIHGAVVGPFIYLVQAEILAGVGQLHSDPAPAPGLHEVDTDARQWIAEEWMRTFTSGSGFQ